MPAKLPDETIAKIHELHAAGVSGREIARQLGMNDDKSVRNYLKRADEHAVPTGHLVKGVSTLLGPDGATKLQWVKTREDETLRAVEAAVKALAETIQPVAPVVAPNLDLDEALINQYTITDAHIGMLAWSRETGARWDLDIAEDLLSKLFISMINSAPAAHQGILDQHGDMLHFDSLMPLTPTSQNILDADSRYQKVVEVTVRVLRRIVDYMLMKHERVIVYMHEGNHDMAGSVWLRVLFSQLYANEPRVYVEKSPLPYVAMRHGNTMLAYHHGHMVKNASLPLIFAARFPVIWGQTTKRYIHVGHNHHVDEKEFPGVKVIQHPTLAAPDAFNARGGYISERQASCITYHLEYGEVGRMVWVPEMVGFESRRADL